MYHTMSNSNSTKTHCCPPCGYLCNTRSNLTKHYKSMKHIERIKNPDAVVEGEYKCKNCIKTYKSNQGLWRQGVIACQTEWRRHER